MRDERAFWDDESAKWLARRAAMSMLLDNTDAVMTRVEFDKLDEYSTSVPTGAPVGRIWKCRRPWRAHPDIPATWWLGEYWDDGQIEATQSVPIRWRRIHLVDGALP